MVRKYVVELLEKSTASERNLETLLSKRGWCSALLTCGVAVARRVSFAECA